MAGILGEDNTPNVELFKSMPPDLEPELRKVQFAFWSNNLRWMSHAVLPEKAAHYGILYEKAVRSALWNNFGHPFLAEGDVGYLPRLIEESIENKGRFDGDAFPERVTPEWDLVFHESFMPPLLSISNYLSEIFHSQLISAWTMFETLASDLWIAAVDTCPDPLALLRGKHKRIPHRSSIDEQEQESKRPEKQFVLLKDLLATTGGTFDASRSMGRVLAASRRVSFITLKGIRQAYSASFVEDYKDIDLALAPKELDEACLVRNVIVHSAGVADATYLADCKEARVAPRAEQDELLVLDQTIVKAIINPVVECSIALINGVDQWLKTHRKKAPPAP